MINNKVLVIEDIHQDTKKLLTDNFSNIITLEPNNWLDKLTDKSIEAMIIRAKSIITDKEINQLSNLKIIARIGVGVDNIDIKSATKKNILVINLPGILNESVAEHTIMMMLNLVRNSFPFIQATRNNEWEKRNIYCGDELRDKTLGILGMGAIGQAVAKIASVFGMNIIYCDKQDKDVDYQRVNFEKLLLYSDILSLHIGLNDETKYIINKQTFLKVKKGLYIVNLGRGKLINHHDLLEALNNNIIAGYASDVFDTEPPQNYYDLLSHKKVIITPHIAALTNRTFKKMCETTINNVINFFNSCLDNKFIINNK